MPPIHKRRHPLRSTVKGGGEGEEEEEGEGGGGGSKGQRSTGTRAQPPKEDVMGVQSGLGDDVRPLNETRSRAGTERQRETARDDT